MSLNKVQLIGHLGQDPEVRTFGSGGSVCNLRVATTETWRDKSSGERKEKTEWTTVAIFAEHAVKFAEQYLRKGSKVYVEGKLETRKWQDQSGADRYSTEVVIRPYSGELQGLDARGEHPNQRTEQRTETRRADPARQAPSNYRDDLDSEIPF